MDKKSEVIHVRTTPDLRRQIEAAAQRDRRSLSAMAEMVLLNWAATRAKANEGSVAA